LAAWSVVGSAEGVEGFEFKSDGGREDLALGASHATSAAISVSISV
jgi:hypothetical protein